MTITDPAILSYSKKSPLPPPPPPPPGPPPPNAPTGPAARPLPSLENGGWKCVRCGNINYSHKLFCNMRKCNAPKPLENWNCHACGVRSVKPLARECDNCLAERKTTRDEEILLEAHRTGTLPTTADKKNTFIQELLSAPFGSWICVKCNNVNWPARTICNGRTCQKGREASDIEYTRKYKAELEKRGFVADMIKMNSTSSGSTPTVNVPSDSPLPGSTVASGVATPAADTIRGDSHGSLSHGRGYGAPGRNVYHEEVSHLTASKSGSTRQLDMSKLWKCELAKRTHCNKHGCGVVKPDHGVESS
ncbi:hypothetical protein Pmar_PMAR016569 [Perkinsus marinus ATCC 50983]|uniref:RanBP2-type domain-containing protein n=1 Tax=Perkinsus marinus (strain ATCC 50983 / TXsc) TaxID=423536 RepID=C5KTJ0_PERM5|nr:hypothetical protein Pmar_PMAR016569 [Perkinsus marinus ATCC 50983]EER12169.1 hypothetical protein Pmar_PMAR016569 [Perkinsus marinus ATCC 50983]|eukprot:XP_002780374.1 hypothetical protein Pmar_PMAR016569 [Perkinsus marinus ATCC 50983]